jgi:hypothetical protein
VEGPPRTSLVLIKSRGAVTLAAPSYRGDPKNIRRIANENPASRAKEHKMKKPVSPESASALIDERIASLTDWRGKVLAKVRKLIHEADPEIVEEWKFMGTPVFYHDGIVCTGEAYKSVVKMTFAKGAALKDPSGLFNSSLEGNIRRAIDIRENEKINEPALKALIREAVHLNQIVKSTPKPKSKPARKSSR